MNRLPDRSFEALGGTGGSEVHHNTGGVLLLQIGFVDGWPEGRAEIGMLDVADDAHDGGIELRIVAAPFHYLAADGVSRRAEEALGESEIDDSDFGLPIGIGGR